MLELRALGSAEIATDTSILTPSQEIVFAAALYLTLERERKVSRTGLAELLWPRVDPSIRAHRLRQTLLQLKKLGFPVVADRDTVRISTQIVADTDQIEASDLSAPGRESSLDFLPGYSPRFSEPYADWVDRKRSQMSSICSRVLVAQLGRERARANWNAVDGIARSILRLDPYNESAVLAFSEACAMRGQKREAVKLIDDYLREIGGNADIRLPAQLLRKRIIDSTTNTPAISHGDSPFVGRESEVQTLTQRLKQAQKGRGGACLIVGEPGIGKSKLASEVAKFAGLQGIRTQTVSCQRTNIDRPLSVLVDLVPWLRDMPGALGCSQETLAALRRLTDFDSRVGELSSAAAESHALHRALRNALFDLLDAITDEVPLLLVFDDVQWIDRISAEILAEMIAWSATKRLLVVMNSRHYETALIDLFVLGSTDVLRLSSLRDDAAHALLTSVVGATVADGSQSQLGWILEVGEGNPFFLQELAKHWVESGGRAEAPSSVAKVLTDRLARLDPLSLKVLQACTVLGQSSTIERVEGLLDCAPHELLGAIQELSAAGMLSCTADSAELTPLSLRTRHDLLANAVLGGLGPASRAFLHRRAGLALEKELSGEWKSTAVLWACAFHWHHAGDRDRALSVVRSCAEHLLEVGLPQAASDTLDRALEYCSTDEQRLSVLTRQVHALQMAGQWTRSKEVLVRCRQIRTRATPTSNQHDAFEIMLYDASYRTSLDLLSLLPEITSCVQCPDASTEQRVQAGVMALKIATDIDPLLLDSIYREIEPLIAKLDARDSNRAEAEMVFHAIRGDGELAIAAAQVLIDTARESKDPVRLSRALTNAANSHRINGSLEDAEECLYEALDCCTKHHMVDRARLTMQQLVRTRLTRGDIVSAREILEQSKALPATAENLVGAEEQHLLEIRLSLHEGNVARAAAEFSLLQKVSSIYTPSRRAAQLALEVRVRLEQGVVAETLRPLVSELEKIHTTLWAIGLQDLEAESLFIALDALGERERGTVLLKEYLTKQRRERRPPPHELAKVVSVPLSRGREFFTPRNTAGSLTRPTA